MLWTLTYRADDRTLTDAEVDAAHARVVVGAEARRHHRDSLTVGLSAIAVSS